MKRNLDGAYFRVERAGKWENICFTDLTREEQITVMENRSEEWMRRMIFILADTIKEIGEAFDIVRGDE